MKALFIWTIMILLALLIGGFVYFSDRTQKIVSCQDKYIVLYEGITEKEIYCLKK